MTEQGRPYFAKPGTHPETCPMPGLHTRTSCNYFREQLAKYGRHLPGCTTGLEDCSCGLLQALAARPLAAASATRPNESLTHRTPDPVAGDGSAGAPDEDPSAATEAKFTPASMFAAGVGAMRETAAAWHEEWARRCAQLVEDETKAGRHFNATSCEAYRRLHEEAAAEIRAIPLPEGSADLLPLSMVKPLRNAVDEYDQACARREHIGSYRIRIQEAAIELVEAIRTLIGPPANPPQEAPCKPT